MEPTMADVETGVAEPTLIGQLEALNRRLDQILEDRPQQPDQRGIHLRGPRLFGLSNQVLDGLIIMAIVGALTWAAAITSRVQRIEDTRPPLAVVQSMREQQAVVLSRLQDLQNRTERIEHALDRAGFDGVHDGRGR